MAQDSQLRTQLSNQKNSAATIRDCQSALEKYKDLRIQRKHFIFNDGSSKELSCLEGTIPITYKYNVYNIPVIIWLLDTHPYNAPMVYVQPTQTMNIRAGPNVDRSGKVTVPYLSNWRQGKSDLSSLLQVLVTVFGESPPVFSKSSRQQQQPTAQPNLPYPASTSSQSGMPQPPLFPNSGTAQGYPGSYPPTTTGYTSSPAVGGYPAMPTPGTTSPYPPVTTAGSKLPYPPVTAAGANLSYPATNSGVYDPYTSQTPAAPGYPSPYGHSSPYPTQPTGYPPSSTTSSAYPPSNTTSSAYSGYQSYSQYPNPAAAIPGTASTGLTDEEMRRSLLSALEDKTRRHLKEISSTHNAETDVLRKTQEDLKIGQSKLEEMERAIDTETVECMSAITLLQQKIAESKEMMEKQKTEDILPENAIDSTAPLYKQLMNAFAEEQAMGDAIYLLGEALRQETLDIEVYLKKVRSLSRRQFMLKALIQKCREKAGLSGVYI